MPEIYSQDGRWIGNYKVDQNGNYRVTNGRDNEEHQRMLKALGAMDETSRKQYPSDFKTRGRQIGNKKMSKVGRQIAHVDNPGGYYKANPNYNGITGKTRGRRRRK